MSRLILAAGLLIALQAEATAQFLPPTTPPSGYGGFGGGPKPLNPVILPNPPLITPPSYMSNPGMGGGFVQPGFPFHGIWPVYGLGYPYYGYPYYGYGFGYNYSSPYAAIPDTPPEPTIVLANVFPAVLTVEFPAAAEVWVNGEKAKGGPFAEWTLTSPELKQGESFTFEVKARWKSGGKTYSYERTVTVASGDRSRALVISGSEVKE